MRRSFRLLVFLLVPKQSDKKFGLNLAPKTQHLGALPSNYRLLADLTGGATERRTKVGPRLTKPYTGLGPSGEVIELVRTLLLFDWNLEIWRQ
jgi:hypothetical protein